MDKSTLLRKLAIDILLDSPNDLIAQFNLLFGVCKCMEVNIFSTTNSEVVYYKTVGAEKIFVVYIEVERHQLWFSNKYFWTPMNKNRNIWSNEFSGVITLLLESALNMTLPHAHNTMFDTEMYINQIINS